MKLLCFTIPFAQRSVLSSPLHCHSLRKTFYFLAEISFYVNALTVETMLQSVFFFNLMHMHFKRHSFATYQVLAADFASPIPFIWGTCERAFCYSSTLLSSKGSCTIVWPVETRVSAKITGTLATRSGCLQKEKTDMTYDKLGNWRTSNFWTEKLQTWGLINERFQQQTECSFSFWIWRFLFAFFCFSPNGVPWCSLALESSMNV